MRDEIRTSETGRVSDQAMQSLLAGHARLLAEYLREKLPQKVRGTLEPEDLLQEIQAVAWMRRETFRSTHPSSFDRWIRAITDRKLLDLKKWAGRARRGGNRVDGELQFGSVCSAAPPARGTAAKTPSRVAAAREARRELHAALERLPDDLRRAFVLCEIEGHSLEQAARAMGRSPAAVRSMLYRGRAKLRSLLGDPRRLFSDSGIGMRGAAAGDTPPSTGDRDRPATA